MLMAMAELSKVMLMSMETLMMTPSFKRALSYEK